MGTAAHREPGYALLRGRGLEIGALHEPTPLPAGSSVEYFDVLTAEDVARWFPELQAARLVRVDHHGDLDRDGLSVFADGRFDFVILSHVLEHVANPVKVVRDVFRIVRAGGVVLIAVPDKDHTFDRPRALTPFQHLWEDYQRNVTENSDEHYLDFLRHVGPHVFAEPPENLPGHLTWVRRRREHAHVWNSASCAEFLLETFLRLGIPVRLRYESTGDINGIEYFSVWEKAPPLGRTGAVTSAGGGTSTG